MLPEYQEYYQALLAVFHSQENEDKAEMEMVESCFRASLDCWSKMTKLARKIGFCDESEEIMFFKVDRKSVV